jgi:hypothetical protein
MFKKYKVCAYCGDIVAYRHLWDYEFCQVQGQLDTFNKIISFFLFGYSFYAKWKRIINGACPCEIPSSCYFLNK